MADQPPPSDDDTRIEAAPPAPTRDGPEASDRTAEGAGDEPGSDEDDASHMQDAATVVTPSSHGIASLAAATAAAGITAKQELPGVPLASSGGDTANNAPVNAADTGSDGHPSDLSSEASGKMTPASWSGSHPKSRAVHITEQTLPYDLGRYTLLKKLGAGGMAEVFLAEQGGLAGFKKRVVIKRILPHLAENERFVSMFTREARVAAQLSHTNIVQIFELGEDDGVYYIAMEYVDGLSLFQLARRAWKTGRHLPMELVVTAIADAAAGLHYASAVAGPPGAPLGLVHRDISPDNLMINIEGVTKVLDFGIAKASESQTVTKTGEMKGKIPFMAPEQLHGRPVDHRSDLYALGVTLYWLLTGQRPFKGETDLLLMQKIVSDDPVPPSQLNPEVPRVLEEWTLALLRKDPNDRPQTGAEVTSAFVGMTSGRRSPFSQFVREIAEAQRQRKKSPKPPDFQRCKPTTETIKRDSHKRPPPPAGFELEVDAGDVPLVDATLISAPEDTAAAPAGEPDDDVDLLAGIGGQSRLRMMAAAGGAAALLLVVTLVFALGDDEPAIEARDPAGAQPAATAQHDPSPAEDPPPGSGTPEQEPPRDDDAQRAAANTNRAAAGKSARKKPKTRRFQATAPSYVKWLLPSGRRIGAGSGKFTVPASTRAVVAYNTKLHVKTTVPLHGDIRYSALPKGKLDVRAYPYADVYAGATKLGTTPFSPLSLTAGTYDLKFVYQGQTQKRRVVIKPQQASRVKIRFDG